MSRSRVSGFSRRLFEALKKNVTVKVDGKLGGMGVTESIEIEDA